MLLKQLWLHCDSYITYISKKQLRKHSIYIIRINRNKEVDTFNFHRFLLQPMHVKYGIVGLSSLNLPLCIHDLSQPCKDISEHKAKTFPQQYDTQDETIDFYNNGKD